MRTALILLALWLALNLVHALWVETRRYCWEKRITRDKHGLLPGAGAYRIGNGPIALLFIHGFADTPCIWRRMTRHLAQKGPFTCRALRLAGSAEPAAQAKQQSLTHWRTQIADEIIRLSQDHPTVWLVGHSMGGALALDAALRMPTSVDGVAVLAPLLEVARKRSPLLSPNVWFRLARFSFGLSPTFESPFSASGVAVDDPSFTYTRDRFIPFCVYRGLFELVHANRKQSARLNKPVFALTAARDSVVDTPAALRWFNTCPGPKKIRDLPDVGHVIPLEADWQSLTDELAAFICQHAEAAGISKSDYDCASLSRLV